MKNKSRKLANLYYKHVIDYEYYLYEWKKADAHYEDWYNWIDIDVEDGVWGYEPWRFAW